MPPEDSDPIISSYNVYISPPTSEHHSTRPKLYLFQYPSHRPHAKPYNSTRSQKPLNLRVKPKTGLFELDIPLHTHENYNSQKGLQFAQNLSNASVSQTTQSHGLANGFASSTAALPQDVRLQDMRQHDGGEEQVLKLQTLGGKAPVPTDRDPIYMLATLRNDEIHLSQLDAVVQMRPQLHHLDAEDELNRKREASSRNNQKVGYEGVPAKLETKAIELKLKDNKEDIKDKSLNANAKLLRDIQADSWVAHEWIDGDESNDSSVVQSLVSRDGPALKAVLDNDEWLDKMSSPGIDLRMRLKGRDRERARRKRQERLRAGKAEVAGVTTGHSGPFVEGSQSESSEDEEDHDELLVGGQTVEESTVDLTEPPPVVKQELDGPDSTMSGAQDMSTSAAITTPKRRGRPKKQAPPIDDAS